MLSFGLDPDTKRRRLATAELYTNLAIRYEETIISSRYEPVREQARRNLARVEGVIERCIQGV